MEVDGNEFETKQGAIRSSFYSIPLYVQPLVTNNRIHILFWTLLWCRFLGNDNYIQSWYSLWRVSINCASSNMGHRWITRIFPETPKLKMIPHEIQLKMLWSIHLDHCMHSWHLLRLELGQLITNNNRDFFLPLKVLHSPNSNACYVQIFAWHLWY